VEVDGGALTAHMREVVERLRREKYEDVLACYDVEVVEGYGRLRTRGRWRWAGECWRAGG